MDAKTGKVRSNAGRGEGQSVKLDDKVNHDRSRRLEVDASVPLIRLPLLLKVDPERITIVEDIDTVAGSDDVPPQVEQRRPVGDFGVEVHHFEIERLFEVGGGGCSAAQ